MAFYNEFLKIIADVSLYSKTALFLKKTFWARRGKVFDNVALN